jgi:hypothetical protein
LCFPVEALVNPGKQPAENANNYFTRNGCGEIK